MWWLLFFFEAIMLIGIIIIAIGMLILSRYTEFLLEQNRELERHVKYLHQQLQRIDTPI